MKTKRSSILSSIVFSLKIEYIIFKAYPISYEKSVRFYAYIWHDKLFVGIKKEKKKLQTGNR